MRSRWPSSALRFLYRILFLLYAEAKPELGVLPAGAPEYDAGYSLDRLRDLVQVELPSPQARPVPTCTSRWVCCSGWSTRAHSGGSDGAVGPPRD